MLRNTFVTILISILLSACVTNPQYAKFAANNTPSNLMPMYGYPEIKKTESQRIADEKFIQTVVAESGSREKSAKQFAALGWAERRNDKINEAMRRFNQSWLLDSNYYQPYWGFGVIALVKQKPSEAIVHLDKALELIDEQKEKSRLLVDAARANAWEGHATKQINPVASEELLKKAVSLIDKALKLDPKNGNAYYYGVQAYRSQGNYKEAWKMVKTARAVASYKFDGELIAKLSKEMPEPE